MMKVSEAKKLLAGLPDDDRICVAAWFANGERLYLPHQECGGMRAVEFAGQTFHVLGRFDDCFAHQIPGPTSLAQIIQRSDC